MDKTFLQKIFLCLTVFVFAVLTSTTSRCEEPRRIGQTVVFTTLPTGFEAQPNFPGLVNKWLQGSIVVIESNKATYEGLLDLFSDIDKLNRQFSSGHVQMREIETLQSVSGQSIRVAHGTQSTNDGDFEKWMSLFQGERTALVTFSVRKPNKINPDYVKAFFQNVKIGLPPSEAEMLKSLSFDIDIQPPFHFSSNVGGSGLMLMGGPDELNSLNDQPFIIIFHTQIKAPNKVNRSLAEAALRSTSTFKAAVVRSSKDILFAGFNGIELVGETTAQNVTISFKQWFALDAQGRQLRMVAAGPATVLAGIEPIIEKIAKSVRARPM